MQKIPDYSFISHLDLNCPFNDCVDGDLHIVSYHYNLRGHASQNYWVNMECFIQHRRRTTLLFFIPVIFILWSNNYQIKHNQWLRVIDKLSKNMRISLLEDSSWTIFGWPYQCLYLIWGIILRWFELIRQLIREVMQQRLGYDQETRFCTQAASSGMNYGLLISLVLPKLPFKPSLILFILLLTGIYASNSISFLF